MADYIELFMGSQDGLVLPAPPKTALVLWIPSPKNLKHIDDHKKAGTPLTPDEAGKLADLPYVQQDSARFDDAGNRFSRYEYCEEMLDIPSSKPDVTP